MGALEWDCEYRRARNDFAFVKGEVIYAKSEEEKARYENMKTEMLLRLQDKAFHMPKSLEFLETAQEIFQTMLFDDNLCNIRKAAGGVCSYLMNAIAMVNGTYLESGYMNLTKDLHSMKEYPAAFEKTFQEMISQNTVESIRQKVYELIRMTRNFLTQKIEAVEKEETQPDYDDLAMWYQEMRYTFRRVGYYTSINSVEDSYLLGCYLQIEFDAVREDFNLKKMDLMSSFDKDNLYDFARKAEEIESYLVKVLEEKNAHQNKYSFFEEFIRDNE